MCGFLINAKNPFRICLFFNRHNEDGSYTYGYEGADGSFKIETKSANGEVKGKYGYTDETGKVRVVEYGANKYGFQPVGEGITVAPPTLVDETTDKNGRRIVDYEEEEQQAQPPVIKKYQLNELFSKLKKHFQQPKYRPQPKQHAPRPQAPPQQYYEYEQVQEAPRPAKPRPQSQFPSQFGPPPPHFQIPGAAPAPSLDVVYAPRPRPARIEPADYEDVGPQTFPQAAPIPRGSSIPSQLLTSIGNAPRPKSKPYQAPQPQQQQHLEYQPQVQYQQQQPAPRQLSQGSSSLLDQLAKDYALPQGGSAPLHDISFGYY